MSLIGAAIGLGASLFGAYKSARAKRAQEKEIKANQGAENAWYNQEYYKNYLDTAEARAAMKRVEETLNKRAQQTQASAAISGATPEAVIASNESDNKTLDDVATNIAAASTERKNRVSDQHMANRSAISQQRMAQHSMNENGGANLMANGLGILGAALEASSHNKISPDKPTGSGIAPNGTGTIRIGADGKMYQD